MQHFAILAMPRSGSTRLCDIVGRHPAAACHQEIFHHDEVQAYLPRHLEIMDRARRDADPGRFLDKFLAFNEVHFRGRQCHGFKVLFHQKQAKALVEIVGPDRRLKKIILNRNNVLACFASLRMAVATGEWQRTGTGGDAAARDQKIPFEREKFNAFVGEQTLMRAAVERAAQQSGRPLLSISYDETLTQAGLGRVWDFLELAPIADEGIFRKVRTRPLLDCFSNPDAVVEAARSVGRPDWLEE
jgi:LPS sulfotransferase NodH